MSAATTASAVAGVFRDAGVTGRLHALDIDTGREFAVGAAEPVVMASVFKLPLLVAFFRLVGEGVLDAREPVVLGPGQRCAGATGTSVLLDEVTMSLRDLATMMITVSDNAAADVLFARVGPDTVNATTAELGLTDTHIAFDSRRLHDSLLEDAGTATMSDLWVRLGEPGFAARLRALDPARTNRTTARDMTRLLARIWTDTAAPADACAQMRRMLGLQVWPHRLASGFPYDDVLVSGKTGTLPLIRNEVGVVDYPDGGRYAVAVFTRAATPVVVSPPTDAAIGTAARLAVRHLRS
ncbi:class A beta-lactamase-related serine hydrolase [Yinghuangia sp. ASG 101]|uniref:serine hydrolase n=1 Tax=Yinghuangia sp. ASG 101 TaxID=2896848 RepID=UPI001E49568C|nr:serine hydrolase [Yinghuangia sp. ASG 101]UGQ11757.1 class A beta-lactamase-related serine hydrolase [Yinghuangia sp. ASG 101]